MRGEKERMKHENLSRAINCKALNKKKDEKNSYKWALSDSWQFRGFLFKLRNLDSRGDT